MMLLRFEWWAFVAVLVVAVSVALPSDASIDVKSVRESKDDKNEGAAKLPVGENTLTKAQKIKIASVFGGIGPVLGPFSPTNDNAKTSTTSPNSDLDLDDPNLNSVLGNINWEKEPDTIEEAEVIRWLSGNNPKQVHLSLGNTTTEMVVLWATENPTPSGYPSVAYGLKENSLTNKQLGRTINFYNHPKYATINATDPNLPMSSMRYHHRVELLNLLPNSTYFYQIVCEHCYNPINSFKTLPSNQDWQPSFLVYGDLGRLHKAPIIERLTKEALSGNHTAILHVGDFAYDLHYLNGVMGDSFFNQIEPSASRLPYMVCPGNHEMGHWLDALHFVHRFSMPRMSWPMDETSLWYSFDVGNVHFISYSSEVFFYNRTVDEEERQKAWLDRDLTEANLKTNRDRRPWIIAFGHRPFYCSNLNRDSCTRNNSAVRRGFEELFFRHGVDLIIQAHEHSYERLWPVHNNRVWGYNYTNPGAPVHIVCGAAGCNEQDGYCLDPILGTGGPWSAYHTWVIGTYGYGRLKVVNDTHLYWEQILSVNGQVIDSFWLMQNHHGPFSEWIIARLQEAGYLPKLFIMIILEPLAFQTAGNMIVIMMLWCKPVQCEYVGEYFVVDLLNLTGRQG